MDPHTLVPTPDVLVAPAFLFNWLNILTFMVHILLINIMLGSMVLVLLGRLRNGDNEGLLHSPLEHSITNVLALAINFGVAPLLFVQVIYGHLLYTSSILMATFWILIIPLLILAYYGAYIHIRRYTSTQLSKGALGLSLFIVLVVAFFFTNNLTMMQRPDTWTRWFAAPGGTLLNLKDPTLAPRYLHFIIASVAVASLFLAVRWKRRGGDEAAAREEQALRFFAAATFLQVLDGIWFLLALPDGFLTVFMGGNLFYSILLWLGMLAALSAITLALMKKTWATVAALGATVALMVITRANLRSLYLADYFSLKDLSVNPEYSPMILFFLVLLAGIAAIVYMLKIAFASKGNEGGQS